MSEGEHTIISKIPRERLNQIAGRKLAALGIPVRLGADRETLEGELALSRVAHPLTGQALPRARFAVEGHDRLRFLDAPLASLGALPFYDVDRVGALDARIAEELQGRAAVLQDLAARLRALRLEPQLDADRLLVRAVVKTVQHAFELLGGPEGFRVSRVAPVGGRPFEVPPELGEVRLEDHPSLVDLELALAGQAAGLAAAARAHASQPAGGAARVEAAPPPRTALTLGALVKAFGEDAAIAPTAALEVFQDFESGGTRYRFVATRDVGAMFKGRLIGPAGDTWSDKFDLDHFPGTAQVAAAALGSPAGASSEDRGAAVPGHLLPHQGEVWVMNVVVEAAGADEVRYVGTDIDGRPYGAARKLKRSDFEAVFSRIGNGWRLLVAIDQVAGDSVIYRQLDPQRQPIGAPRKMAASVLVANFVPEAAAF